jgi:ribonuclease VapC
VTVFALDSSVLVAVFKNESGSDIAKPLLRGSLLSTVNAAECFAVMARARQRVSDTSESLQLSGVRIIDFDIELAEIAGALEEKTKPQGLSLGDRACLALALRENLPVLTADRHWKDVAVGVEIRLMR